MVAALPRPGVEIVQTFKSASPTIVRPTLVPCNVGPFFEVIEVTKKDGTVNQDAKLSTPYQQLGLLVSQTAFPSPRKNIDEVDVQENTVRAFLLFGPRLLELSRTSSFLRSLDVSTKPSVTGTASGPYAFGDPERALVVQFNAHTAVGSGKPAAADLPATANILIKLGGTMSLDEVVAAINATIPGVASKSSAPEKLVLSSTRYGAGASVVVRASGDANPILGFSTLKDQVAVGHGFFAADAGDGTSSSPRIEEFGGTSQRDVDAANVGTAVLDFTTSSLKPGDVLVADGVNIGEIDAVAPARLTMEVKQSIMKSALRFAPRRVYAIAKNLSYPPPAASVAAFMKGSTKTVPASVAWLVGASQPVAVPAGESLSVTVAIDGVAQATEVIGSGAGWAGANSAAILQAILSGINGQALTFEAYFANVAGDEVASAALGQRLGLRTKADNVGAGARITLESASALLGAAIGYGAAPYADVGEDARYLPGTHAQVVGPGEWDGQGTGGAILGETIITVTKVAGAAMAAETVTWSGNFTDSNDGLLDAIDDWNAQSRFLLAYEANALGVPTTGGGYFAIRTRGENFGTGASIQVTGSDSQFPVTPETAGKATNLNGATFKWLLDNNPLTYDVTLVAAEDDGSVSLQSVIDKINTLTPGVASASDDSPPRLLLTSRMVGAPSQVKIGDGTANSFSGDGGLGFTSGALADGTGRPGPEFAMDVLGNAAIQGQVLRDGLTGKPYGSGGVAGIYMAYKGLRKDVSPDAKKPGLLTLSGGVPQLEAVASPISTDNPGALMTYLTMLNCPGMTVVALGVPDVSADAPDGTPLGYAKCFNFLESQEVYAIATASQIGVVHQAGVAHVRAMSAPENKGERIYFFNPQIPTRALPKILGSGTDANSSGTEGEIVLEVNIAPAFIDVGIDPNADINPTSGPILNEVYLDLGSTDLQYLVQKVTEGHRLTLRKAFIAGDGNADGYYASAFPTGVISDDWSVKIRGAKLLIPGSTLPDKDKTVATIQEVAKGYGDRRAFLTMPDKVGINVTGLEQIVAGYYGTSAIIGMIAGLPPQQGFTNYPITGLTRVVGSNDIYSKKQLDIAAGGGVYILMQEAEGAPVICRHQLSTDLTSIETRELSITKIVDFTAKFLRSGIRNFIGRSNITQTFMDQLGTVINGLLTFLGKDGAGVIVGATINNLVQSADAPDTLLIDITLDVPYPCNYIRVVLVV